MRVLERNDWVQGTPRIDSLNIDRDPISSGGRYPPVVVDPLSRQD